MESFDLMRSCRTDPILATNANHRLFFHDNGLLRGSDWLRFAKAKIDWLNT